MGVASMIMSEAPNSGIIQSMSSRWMHCPGVLVQQLKHPMQPLMLRSVM